MWFYFDFEEDGEQFAKIELFTQEVNQRIKRTMLMVILMMKDIILFFSERYADYNFTAWRRLGEAIANGAETPTQIKINT